MIQLLIALWENRLSRMVSAITILMFCALLGAVSAPLHAQVSATPGPGALSFNTQTTFTFTANVPAGGTTLNWMDVAFQQSVNATPSATEPMCKLRIGTYLSVSERVKVLVTFNTDGSVNSGLYPPFLWTTPAQRSNAFCAVAASAPGAEPRSAYSSYSATPVL